MKLFKLLAAIVCLSGTIEGAAYAADKLPAQTNQLIIHCRSEDDGILDAVLNAESNGGDDFSGIVGKMSKSNLRVGVIAGVETSPDTNRAFMSPFLFLYPHNDNPTQGQPIATAAIIGKGIDVTEGQPVSLVLQVIGHTDPEGIYCTLTYSPAAR